MKTLNSNRGIVLITVVFIAALLSALVIGMLQINTEEVQIMQNQIRGAEALAIAEAGINDALAELRKNDRWDDGFTKKPFFGGTYSVTVDRSRVTSVGTSSQGFTAKMEIRVTVDDDGPPHVIEIDSIKVNE